MTKEVYEAARLRTLAFFDKAGIALTQAERDRKRAELVADPDWQAYLAKAGDFIERQENRILIPTSFSPLK